MIASLGGAQVSKDGTRNYPGSGGMVGGLSFPGGNWAYWGMAGPNYNRFTPIGTNESICLDCEPNLPAPTYPQEPAPPEYPPWLPPGVPLPFPTTTTPTTSPTQIPTTAPGGGNIPCSGRDCGGAPNGPTEIPVEPGSVPGILSTLQQLLTAGARTSVAAVPPLFSFNPPSAGGTTLNTRSLVIFALVGFGAYFLYKKYA